MTKFIIVSTQRTGSTFFRTSLDSHPDICCAGESFLAHYKEPNGYTAYLKGSLKRRAINLLARKSEVYSYLDELYSQLGYEAIGFKFMYAQASRVPRRYPMVMRYVRDHGVCVIHLVRSNSLRVLVSRYRLRASGVSRSRTAVSADSVIIPTKSLCRDLEILELEKQRWNRVLEEFPCLDVTYEQFVSQREQEVRRILKFLGADADVSLSSPLKKIGSDSLQDALGNYDEVERMLRGSRFERFLD